MEKIKLTIKENKDKGKDEKIFCQTCKGIKNFTILQSYDVDEEELLGYLDDERKIDITIDFYNHYQLIQSKGCDSIFMRHKEYFSEDRDEDNHGRTENIYPKIHQDTFTEKNMNIPEQIKNIYKETIRAYNFSCYLLCGAGLRGIIEGICKDKGIKGGHIKDGEFKKTLGGKINGLVESGFLGQQNANTLYNHKLLGDKALHKMRIPGEDELEIAIKIIEGILNSIYEIPPMGEKLKELIKRKYSQ